MIHADFLLVGPIGRLVGAMEDFSVSVILAAFAGW